MKNECLLILMMFLMLSVSGCSAIQKKESPEETVELTISAAASLQDALNDIKMDFEREHPHVKVVFNFGASGALQQQISRGAPVDLFFSAAEDKFAQLVHEGFIEKKRSADLVGNELVLVVPNDSKLDINGLNDLIKIDKISIGNPESVPAGQYAKEALGNLNVWKVIEGKVVYAKDVRQVLTYVESNNVDAGMVYKTDALSSPKVEIAAHANGDTHSPIVYPAGVIKRSSHPKEAKLFYDFLQKESSMKILEMYGFKGLNESK